ncbi:DUF1127 domain-containing protein [Oceanibacterium hippocampi]|uniref:YjiS-like domain-containing protein n=1 Tax=Oceanibacterium hippocampi TaxID=745714 RepID=A0A1Y5RA01_9PROT|nr:DUF1127 domain-containing protein [Oceanibacterium hippocampi]SLN11442.1 hypothetical protein OCH7691_00088 [Oceanibacterium hippocampi]
MSTTTLHEPRRAGFMDMFRAAGREIALWRKRSRARAELARWSERDLHDVGRSISDAVYEINKPFWRE